MDGERPLKTYTSTEKTMYLVGMAGQNVTYCVIGAALAYYLQFTLLIPAFVVSTIMALARVWDAFNDPMMGTIVDKTRTKWGKCRPYLLFAPIPIFAITVACFINFGFFDPEMGIFQGKNALVVLWAAVTYVLWGMAYTVGDIPLWGITALMTEDQRDRAKLLAYAQIAGGIGAGVTIIAIQPVALGLGERFAPLLAPTARVSSAAAGERLGFIAAAAIFGLVGAVTFQMAGLFARERIPASEEKHTLKENFKLMWNNRPFRQILLSGLMGSPRQLLTLAGMPLVTYFYASKDPKKAMVYLAAMGGGLFLGQFLAMGMVPRLIRHVSKKDAYNFSNIAATVPYLAIFILYLIGRNRLVEPGYLVFSWFLFALGGAANGNTIVLQSLMIADAVDYEEYHHGIRPDGVLFSGQTFIVKMTTGIATVLSGIAYTAVGFSDAKVGELNDYIAAGGIPRDNPKYDAFIMLLFFLVSVPPAVGSLLAVIPTWRYCLSDGEHTRILAELNRRRHAAEDGGAAETPSVGAP
ncbi:MAG TPA: glycoside-pentoside-hexuronide (GPH):cation symporter [Clostridiales bacterium]|nr:glycoside-pentoside-hexuronide (GPH):cation symporter [Clostridiales bacterium]HQK73835.1 glycoside-pentoside-hexuronide (GPH):cation symporter [Clostridiales bacterium]